MGIGGGIFLIVIGAILAFAVRGNLSWIDVHLVGWILVLAGVAVLVLSLWFWQQRRTRRRLTLVEQTQLMHHRTGPVTPEPPDSELPPPP